MCAVWLPSRVAFAEIFSGVFVDPISKMAAASSVSIGGRVLLFMPQNRLMSIFADGSEVYATTGLPFYPRCRR